MKVEACLHLQTIDLPAKNDVVAAVHRPVIVNDNPAHQRQLGAVPEQSGIPDADRAAHNRVAFRLEMDFYSFGDDAILAEFTVESETRG
jgi:hypothetical protein